MRTLLLLTLTAAPAPAQCLVDKLTASDGGSNHQFGRAVAISGDTAAVSTVNAEVLYVFERAGFEWMQTAELDPPQVGSGDELGTSIDLDGDTLVAGAPYDEVLVPTGGSVFVYERSGASWARTQQLFASDAMVSHFFGNGVALEGDTLLIGAYGANGPAPSSGKGYVFQRMGGTWIETAQLVPSVGVAGDGIGYRVALAGDLAVLGAPSADAPLSSSGAVFVFRRSPAGWIEEAQLLPSDISAGKAFGGAVAVDGGRVFAGAVGDQELGLTAGAAYVFEKHGSGWIQEAKLLASDGAMFDGFGISVTVEGERCYVGATGADPLGPGSGAVYAFDLGPSPPVQLAKLYPPDGESPDFFGYALDASGGDLFASATRDEDLAYASGAVYAWSANPAGCPPLLALPQVLSLQTGGTQAFEIAAGALHAGQLYLLLGSEAGTSPGIAVDGQLLPLVPGPYFYYTLANPNTPPFVANLGTLNLAGGAQAKLVLPPLLSPALAGLLLHHAYVAFDLQSAMVALASNAEPLLLVP